MIKQKAIKLARQCLKAIDDQYVDGHLFDRKDPCGCKHYKGQYGTMTILCKSHK